MELFVKLVNDWMPLTISAKSSNLDSSILDVPLGPEYASCYVRKDTQILQNDIFLVFIKNYT